MTPFLIALGSAFWLGILLSISPCPLATNIAAMSFLGRQVGRPRRVMLNGLLYALGRTVAYVLLGFLIVRMMMSTPLLAQGLQRFANLWLGPILILVGVVLLGIIKIPMPSIGGNERLQQWALRTGVFAPAALGFLFAMAFCPISAGLFFGSLLALALQHQSTLLIPGAFGVATALPVMAFAVVIAYGASSLGKAFNRLSAFEYWARRITGVIFIVVGVLHMLRWTFHVL